MNMHPKTFRRLMILAVIMVLIVGAGTTVYLVRKAQIRASIAESRERGMQAVKDGDKQAALENLWKYLKNVKDDPEAMIAFANVRRTVPLDKGQHLKDAANWYSSALSRQPDNMEVKHALLEIYPQLQYTTEARALAEEVLASHPDDTTALTALFAAQVQSKEMDQALETAKKWAQADPLSYRAHASVVEAMFRLKKPVDEIHDYASKLVAAHPDDARFEFVSAVAWQTDMPKSIEWLKKAATRTPPDSDFARELASVMEQAGLFAEARKYLEKSVTSDNDNSVLLVLALRLWQDYKYDQVLARLEKVSPDDPAADPDLLALKALASQEYAGLAAATQPVEDRAATTRPATDLTRKVVAELKSRPADAGARTWAAALDALILNPPTTVRDRVKLLSDALSGGKDNGIVRYALAQSYAAQGETDAALAELQRVQRAMPSWEVPYLMSARLLLTANRPAAAAEAAEAAKRRDPANVNADIIATLAYYAMLGESPDAKMNERLLDRTGKIQSWFAPDGEPQTLPIYVTLLARSGNAQAADRAARVAIAARRPYPLESLLSLYSTAQSNKLSAADAILDYAQKQYGLTPMIAQTRALALASAGKSADGLALLRDAAQHADKSASQQIAWQAAIARYLDSTRDPSAGDAWAKLGETYPDNLPVQAAILTSPSRFQNRNLWSAAIERTKQLTGDTAATWRLEKARYVLAGDVAPGNKDLDTTINDLQTLTKQISASVEPRLLLAAAYMRSRDVTNAVKQLEAAVQLRPNDATIGLQLCQTLREAGRLDDSRSYLEGLASNRTLSGENRAKVAAALADVGQGTRAIDLLKSARPDEPDLAIREGLLARLYRRAGRNDEAAEIYTRWLNAPTPEVLILQAGADFFANRGDDASAAKCLAKIAEAPLRPGQRELIFAQQEESHGSLDKAAQLYKKATDTAPTDPSLWRQRVAFSMRARRFDAALADATEALKHAPNDSDLQTLQQQAKLLTSGAQTSDMQPLINLLARDPRNTAGAATLKVLADAKANGQSDDRTLLQLREVADRYPAFLPVQEFLANRYIAAGLTDNAAAIATRAEQLFPADPQAARLATTVYTQMQRGDMMLAAAQRWRRLSNDNPIDADTAIAKATILTGDRDTARKTLQPYLAQARLEPERYPDVLTTEAQLLIADGQSRQAADILSPLVKDSSRWRDRWLGLATTHRTPEDAMNWITQLTEPTTDGDRFSLAATWYDVGARFGRADAMQRAKEILEASSSDNTARHWRLLAYSTRALGDLATAEKAFRKVIELSPQDGDALNNLGYIILVRGGNLADARQFAESAVATSPRSANYLDTLARIQDKQGNTDESLTTFSKALESDPRSIDALLGKAQLLIRINRKDEASALLPQLDLAIRAAGELPADQRQVVDAVKAALKS